MINKTLGQFFLGFTLSGLIVNTASAFKSVDGPVKEARAPHELHAPRLKALREMDPKKMNDDERAEFKRLQDEEALALKRSADDATAAAGGLGGKADEATFSRAAKPGLTSATPGARVSLPKAAKETPAAQSAAKLIEAIPLTGKETSRKLTLFGDRQHKSGNQSLASESPANWKPQREEFLKVLGLDETAKSEVNFALRIGGDDPAFAKLDDNAKWTSFAEVVRALSPEQLKLLKENAEYRKGLLNVVSSFGDLDGAAGRGAELALIVKDYDTQTLESLSDLRRGSAVALKKKIETLLPKDGSLNKEASIAALSKHLEQLGDGAGSIEARKQLLSNFRKLVESEGADNSAKIHALLRNSKDPSARALLKSIHEGEAWAYIHERAPEISRADFKKLLESCGLGLPA